MFKPSIRWQGLVLLPLLASTSVYATNGYFSHGYGTKDKGLAGAGAAYSQDSLAAATNPAGMAFVGERLDLGMQLFNPSPRSYNVSGAPSMMLGSFGLPPGQVESENEFFLIPSVGYNWKQSSETMLGISSYGSGGMNSKYEVAPGTMGVFSDGTAGVNLAQLFVNASVAHKLSSDHAFGASILFAYQRFSAMGMAQFSGFSLDPANLSGNRNSYSKGIGLKLGYQGEVVEGVRLGVSYQSRMHMSQFSEYKGLFAENGDFDIPSTYTVGVAFDVGDSGKLVADVQKINYTEVAAISNPMANLFTGCAPGAPATGAGCLGGSNGGGFGWKDMTIVKIGYEWMVANTIWRVGVSKTDQPIASSEVMFNILAPAVMETHVTFGMTKDMGNNQEFNLSAMYAKANDVTGPNPMDTVQDITIKMRQMDLQFGWAWKY